MEIKEFKNSLIAFDFDNEMVNATDMIKNFPNKRINNFLRRKDVKDFIFQLQKSDTLKSATKVRKGGKEQGTWMHRLLAYKFASYLSPAFEVFVYKSFDQFINEKLRKQQRELDYFWDREDRNDLYS